MVLKSESIKKLSKQERRAVAKDVIKGKPGGKGWSRKRTLVAGTVCGKVGVEPRKMGNRTVKESKNKEKGHQTEDSYWRILRKFLVEDRRKKCNYKVWREGCGGSSFLQEIWHKRQKRTRRIAREDVRSIERACTFLKTEPTRDN